MSDFQVVVFCLEGDNGPSYYGIDITKVQEIIKVEKTTHLPQTPDFVTGVINLRGRLIPVIDLKQRFGIGKSVVTESNRIVVVDIGNETNAGFIVDEVSEVHQLPIEDIAETPDLGGKYIEYITGIGKMQDKLILIIELSNVLGGDEHKELSSFIKSQ